MRTTKSENVKLYIVDLSKQEEVTAFADQVLQEYDRLGKVSTVGFGIRRLFE